MSSCDSLWLAVKILWWTLAVSSAVIATWAMGYRFGYREGRDED